MTKNWNFSLPTGKGAYARQAHADIPNGTFEREFGRDGFMGPAAHIYHRHSPAGFESVTENLAPRAFNPLALASGVPSPWDATAMFRNNCAQIRFWRTEGSMDHLVRNADGDELLFIHNGVGDLYCDFGRLAFEPGDYILLPRGTMWRIEARGAADIMLIESAGAPYRLPDWGNVGGHAPFDPGVLGVPEIDEHFLAQQDERRWELHVKRRGQVGRIVFPFNPLDAAGWKGNLHPVRLNVRDIRPLSSHRLHLPPSVHTTFLGNRFVIITAVPRPVESDAGAMKIPYYHDNVDYEEISFFHRGRLAIRSQKLREGMLTYHPQGFTHGPAPEAMAFMYEAPEDLYESYTVAIDLLDPIEVLPMQDGCEIEAYPGVWAASAQLQPLR
jgi:homogentisate 1,2-dioxygenase